MTNKKDPAGGTYPAGKDRSIIRKSDTILSAADQLNDSPHPPRDRRRSLISRIEKFSRHRGERTRNFQRFLLSSAEKAIEQANQCLQQAEKAAVSGDNAKAQELINVAAKLIKRIKDSHELCRHLSSSTSIDDIVEEICRVGTTERQARITVTDLLTAATAQMRGSAAPPPAGSKIFFFQTTSGGVCMISAAAPRTRIAGFFAGASPAAQRTASNSDKHQEKKEGFPSMLQLQYSIYKGLIPSTSFQTAYNFDEDGGVL